jgi:hypothetical protein
MEEVHRPERGLGIALAAVPRAVAWQSRHHEHTSIFGRVIAVDLAPPRAPTPRSNLIYVNHR